MVPSRDDVLGKLLLPALRRVDTARQPKVADLEVAVLVDEEVAGLQVTVEHLPY
jgi:hypothetical protein